MASRNSVSAQSGVFSNGEIGENAQECERVSAFGFIFSVINNWIFQMMPSGPDSALLIGADEEETMTSNGEIRSIDAENISRGIFSRVESVNFIFVVDLVAIERRNYSNFDAMPLRFSVDLNAPDIRGNVNFIIYGTVRCLTAYCSLFCMQCYAKLCICLYFVYLFLRFA